MELAERLHYPIGRAAALEAQGVCADGPATGAELLSEAGEAWAELDRPLEAARARLLAGQVMVAADADSGPRDAGRGRRGDRARSASRTCPSAPGRWRRPAERRAY